MRPIMRSLTVAALLAALSTPARAQQRGRPIPQSGCALYDTLMAGARHRDLGSALESGRGGSHLIHVVGPGVIRSDARGVGDVQFTIRGDTGVPPESASVQVSVHLVEWNPRPIEERQGSLVVDDSLTVDIGTMAQDSTMGFPSGERMWNVYGVAAPGAFVRLARASKVELRLGRTRWKFPRSELDDLRGALAAYACHP